jgi:ParB family chromosome partitioning protein
MSKDKKVLGKGLSALIDTIGTYENDHASMGYIGPSDDNICLKMSDIEPNPNQPRKIFTDEELGELSRSISAHGVLQPILVRKNGGKYQIIAGERRWRAAQKLDLEDIPAVIRDISDRDAMEIAIIENVQRQNLTSMEEAEAYDRLMQEFDYTQDQLATRLGKSRTYIANTLRLQQLPREIKSLLQQRKLSAGHARALINMEKAYEVAQEVMENDLSVRATEQLVRKYKSNQKNALKVNQQLTTIANDQKHKDAYKSPATDPYIPLGKEKDEDIKRIEDGLSKALGLKVSIDDSDEGGILSIRFHDMRGLDKIIKKLCGWHIEF